MESFWVITSWRHLILCEYILPLRGEGLYHVLIWILLGGIRLRKKNRKALEQKTNQPISVANYKLAQAWLKCVDIVALASIVTTVRYVPVFSIRRLAQNGKLLGRTLLAQSRGGQFDLLGRGILTETDCLYLIFHIRLKMSEDTQSGARIRGVKMP